MRIDGIFATLNGFVRKGSTDTERMRELSTVKTSRFSTGATAPTNPPSGARGRYAGLASREGERIAQLAGILRPESWKGNDKNLIGEDWLTTGILESRVRSSLPRAVQVAPVFRPST